MTALFTALLPLPNSLADDAQFRKGEAIFFLFSLIEKKKKGNSCRGRFSEGGLRTTNPYHLQQRTKTLLRKYFSVEKPSDRTHWGGPLPNPPHFCFPRGISVKWKPAGVQASLARPAGPLKGWRAWQRPRLDGEVHSQLLLPGRVEPLRV